MPTDAELRLAASVLTDDDIRLTAEEFIHRTSAPKEFRLAMQAASAPATIDKTHADVLKEEHENEILGWRMATEAHLETIDRLREEARTLNNRILYLETRLQDAKQPKWQGIDKSAIPEAVQTRADLQRLRLFPDKR
jgi:hypothetical protein